MDEPAAARPCGRRAQEAEAALPELDVLEEPEEEVPLDPELPVEPEPVVELEPLPEPEEVVEGAVFDSLEEDVEPPVELSEELLVDRESVR